MESLQYKLHMRRRNIDLAGIPEPVARGIELLVGILRRQPDADPPLECRSVSPPLADRVSSQRRENAAVMKHLHETLGESTRKRGASNPIGNRATLRQPSYGIIFNLFDVLTARLHFERTLTVLQYCGEKTTLTARVSQKLCCCEPSTCVSYHCLWAAN